MLYPTCLVGKLTQLWVGFVIIVKDDHYCGILNQAQLEAPSMKLLGPSWPASFAAAAPSRGRTLEVQSGGLAFSVAAARDEETCFGRGELVGL